MAAFLAAGADFGAAFLVMAFLASAESLYEFFTWTNSPEATPFLRVAKKVALAHGLSWGIFDCMYFLMAMVEEPVRSFNAEIASIIPALYDILDVVSLIKRERKSQKIAQG